MSSGIKTCNQCGGENDWNALTCAECGIVFEGENEGVISEPEGQAIPSGLKWGLYAFGWAVAVMGMCVTHHPSIGRIMMFPAGFVGILPGEVRVILFMIGTLPAVVFGWGAYLVVTNEIRRARRLSDFFWAYAIFWILLILNVVGWSRLV